MSRMSITFVLLMLIVAAFSQMIIPLITFGATLIVSYAGLMILFRALKNIPGAQGELSGKAYTLMSEEGMESLQKLSPNMELAEKQILGYLKIHGEEYSELNKRYAELIGVSNGRDPLPPYYNHLVTKRMLYEYWLQNGDLRMRHLNQNRIKVADCLTPLPTCEKNQFDRFCLEQSARNV